MNPHLRCCLVIALAMLVTPTLAQVTFVEPYDGDSNHGQWSWGTGNEQVVSLNGNPGGYLQDLTLSTYTPSASTAPGDFSQFVGNYRGRGVIEVGIDLVVLDTEFPYSASSRPLSLILSNDNETPTDFDDDWGAYFVGSQPIPSAGVVGILAAGWNSYDFAVPVDDVVTPDGWVFYECDPNAFCSFTPAGETPPGAHDWNDLMADVDVLEFHYGVPGTFSRINSWDLGLDNPRITSATLAGDLDRNGQVDAHDIRLIPAVFGPCSGACPEDLDGNGIVEPEDLRLLIGLIIP